MRPLANGPWLAVLAVGFLAIACTAAGQGSPSGSRGPAPIASASGPSSAPPAARLTSSPARPAFVEARIPKEGRTGVPPEDAPVVFEEAGLKGGQVVSYELTGDASASYQCWNPKTAAFGTQNWTIKREVRAAAALKAAGGGTIQSVLLLRLPPPAKSSCSAGFRAVAYAGKYEHLLLVDTTNDLRVDPGTYQFVTN